ncbi:hypothetical protein [Nocardia nova]|uniref:hypothetical protein n=1 Tax=Nocardia nova TaxID=37330 RepID=UPI0033E656AC
MPISIIRSSVLVVAGQRIHGRHVDFQNFTQRFVVTPLSSQTVNGDRAGRHITGKSTCEGDRRFTSQPTQPPAARYEAAAPDRNRSLQISRRFILIAAESVSHDTEFDLDGVTYRRHDPPNRSRRNDRARIWVAGPAELSNKLGLIDVTNLRANRFYTGHRPGARITEFTCTITVADVSTVLM